MMRSSLSLRLLKDPLLLVFLLLFIILLFTFPAEIRASLLNFPSRTFIALFILMIITKGMEESGYFSRLSLKILEKLTSEKKVALFLVTFSALLSTFLTNDVALFIMIPLTLVVLGQVKRDLSKVIVFNALAVNVGSALTPIGNPQNLYLWHHWGISFWMFMWLMLPPVLISLILLFLFVFFSFPSVEMEIKKEISENVHRKMFIISLFLLLFFIIMMQINFEYYASVIILAIYLILFPAILKKIDYVLLLVFALIFLNFGALPLILEIPLVSQNASTVYLLSALLSQVMSNVPATIFLSHLTTHQVALAWGVNIGGNGLLIASLANIIAMRLSRRKIFYSFHRYSIPFFVLTLLMVYILFLL